MPKTKIAVTLDAALLEEVDALVRQRRYPNRSQAIEAAVAEQLVRVRRTRLAEACAQLDPAEERSLAEEGLATDFAAWPEYGCEFTEGRFAGPISIRFAVASSRDGDPC